MSPTDSIELDQHEQTEKKLDDDTVEETIPSEEKYQINEKEEMVTSFIEQSPILSDTSLSRVEKKGSDDSQTNTADQANVMDPGEGTSSHETSKSVVINVPDETTKSEKAVNGGREELVTNNNRAVTTTESPVQVFDDNVPEDEQGVASTIKNTKRHEMVRWDNKRSCFFVFFLLLFFIWLIGYWLYATGWLYRKINSI